MIEKRGWFASMANKTRVMLCGHNRVEYVGSIFVHDLEDDKKRFSGDELDIFGNYDVVRCKSCGKLLFKEKEYNPILNTVVANYDEENKDIQVLFTDSGYCRLLMMEALRGYGDYHFQFSNSFMMLAFGRLLNHQEKMRQELVTELLDKESTIVRLKFLLNPVEEKKEVQEEKVSSFSLKQINYLSSSRMMLVLHEELLANKKCVVPLELYPGFKRHLHDIYGYDWFRDHYKWEEGSTEVVCQLRSVKRRDNYRKK